MNPDTFGVCHNGDYTIHFDFDAEWDEYTVKTMRVNYNDYSENIVFSDDKCDLPAIACAGPVEIGVFVGDLHTTTPASIPFINSVKSTGGPIPDPVPEIYDQIINWINETKQSIESLVRPPALISSVTLSASNWVGTSSPYSQVVTIPGVTKTSKIDLNPTVDQLSIFHTKDLAFVVGNNNGVITVYCIGQKPENDYTMQVTITEVATNV